MAKPIKQIRYAFEANIIGYRIDEIRIFLPQNDLIIPKDIFANHSVTKIALWNCKPLPLEIHPEAFRYSRNVTDFLTLKSIDMKHFSWLFLAEFNQLRTIYIQDAFNLQLLNFPPLPSLIKLYVRCSTRLTMNWSRFPRFPNALYIFYLENCGLRDQEMEQILNCIESGPSNATLVEINLDGNALTRIPRQLKHFSRLLTIGLARQEKLGFHILDDLSFFSPGGFLDLSSSHISCILPGAFKGFLLFLSNDLTLILETYF